MAKESRGSMRRRRRRKGGKLEYWFVWDVVYVKKVKKSRTI